MASLSSALGSDLRCGAKGCIGSEDTERVEVFRWESSTLGRKMLLLELSPFSKYDRELIEHILDKRNTGTCSTFLPDTVLVYVIL